MSNVSILKPYLTLEELGLSPHFLAELTLKHIFVSGMLSQRELIDELAISWKVLEQILTLLRKEAKIETMPGIDSSINLRYKLTEHGTRTAWEALSRSGYVGRAPVPLESYTKVIKNRARDKSIITQESIVKAFTGVVLSKKTLNRIGPALNSGRAVFIYGPSGTGKTYISKKLAFLLGDEILIPYAISIGELIVQVFDPIIHKPSNKEVSHDKRYVLCARPVIITGGELTADMLEVQYDSAHKTYQAPLQLKATGGIYVIDDLGRQKASAVEILNRWIIPMEERIDYLAFGFGRRFPVIFDATLIFSTNIDPLQLADEAFLRRLGYKIRFDYSTKEEFLTIWKSICEERGIEFNQNILLKFIEDFYVKNDIPLLHCHPRDLLGLISDSCNFQGIPIQVNEETWKFAIENYFVNFET